MKINRKILIFAMLVGLLTAIGLNFYINNLEKIQKNQISYSRIVVAANPIPANTKVTSDMVILKSIPAESVHPESISSTDKIIGGITKTEIVKDEPILSSKVVVDTKQATLAYRVLENMRAISIPDTEVSGVAGFINVGDKIDILVTYDKKDINLFSTTYTQLQNIEVLAVGNAKQSTDDKQKALPTSITVLVSPRQAEVLAYAVTNGSLFLTLRNPIDSKKENLNYYNSQNFSTYNER